MRLLFIDYGQKKKKPKRNDLVIFFPRPHARDGVQTSFCMVTERCVGR